MSHDLRAAEGGHPLDMLQFLAGRTIAYGVFQDRFGRVRRSFKATVSGWWDGPVFVLDEAFVYNDGDREARQWRVTKGAAGRFTATCFDCVAPAHGVFDADGWRMRYNFRLQLKTRSLVARFDDRMIQVGRHLAINRAKVSKWGITLGDVTIVFERQDGLERQERPRQMADYAEAAE